MTQYVDIQYIRNALGITGTKESCKGCKYNEPIGFACNTYKAPSFAIVCEVLDDAPIVEAEPVIRCKDCKHRDWDVIDIPYGHTKRIEWCSIRYNADGENVEVAPNDFCSKAESKVSSNFE